MALSGIQSERLLIRIRKFTQIPEALGSQKLIEMAETGQRRHKINPKAAAVPVKLQDIGSRQRRIIPPHLAEPLEQIGMLNIQLKLIYLIETERVRQMLQIGKRRDSSSRHIMVITSVRDLRRVFNLQARQHRSLLPDDLAQSLDAPEKSPAAVSRNVNCILGNGKAVTLLAFCRLNVQDDRLMHRRSSYNLHLASGVLLDLLLQKLRVVQALLRAGYGQPDRSAVFQLKASAPLTYMVWLR